jgi:hypothetical protein
MRAEAGQAIEPTPCVMDSERRLSTAPCEPIRGRADDGVVPSQMRCQLRPQDILRLYLIAYNKLT